MADLDAKTATNPFPDEIDHRNVMMALTERALTQPDAPALEIGDRAFSYAELHASVARAAQYLHRQGVVQGNVVALRLSDPVPLAFAMFALMRIGATPMSISPSMAPEQVRELLREAGAQCFLAEPGFGVRLLCPILAFSEALIDSVAAAPQEMLWPDAPAAPCMLITGSGTTGKPRLIALTHALLRVQLATQLKPFGLVPGDRVMTVSPLHFALPTITVLSSIFGGATGVVWDQRGNLRVAVALARPDILYLSVMHAEQLLQLQPSIQTPDLAAIRVVVVTSSTVSETLRRRMRRDLNARVYVSYGTNEAAQLTTAFPYDLDELAGGVGRPNPGVRVEVVDAEDSVVKPGAVGQVRVRGGAQIRSYFNQSDQERFRGGWFYPGDLAKWAPCGQLVLMGRSDEMMIMNGINIYPADIELVLCEHPAVREAAAFALRHLVAQDLPVCVVSLNHGMQLSKAELMNFARERLGYKAPHVLAITDAIPRNLQGKLVRSELMALIQKEMQNEVSPSAEHGQPFMDQRKKTAAPVEADAKLKLAERFSDEHYLAKSDTHGGVAFFSEAGDRRNVMLALSTHALARPDALAVEIGDQSLTYSQLNASVLRAAQYLYRQGVGQRAVVALLLTDPVLLALAMFALMRIGATPMPISPTATPQQMRELLNEATADWFLTDPGFELDLPCPVMLFSEALISSKDLSPHDDLLAHEPASPCLLITGSGTTGKPRLMAVTHAQMRERLTMQQERYGVTVGVRCMLVTPVYFSVSAHNLMAPLLAGATAIVWDQRTNLGHAVMSAKPDVLSLTMMHAEKLLELHQGDPSMNLDGIRVVTLTSSTISEVLRQRLRVNLRAQLHIVYGSNEVYAATVVFPQELDEIADGVGRAAPGVLVEIVDDKDLLIAPGEVGQVRVRSPAQISGYFRQRDPERFRGGWFYPGDLARWAPCGQLVLMGRTDEMMIMNGINIYPSEIELAMREHAAVRDVAAFALRHQVAQELPVCVVALNEGSGLSKRELLDFARLRLGAKAPRIIAIAAGIPRNLQGKPLRAELIELIQKEMQNDAPPSAEQAQAFIEERNKAAELKASHQRCRGVVFDFILPTSPAIENLRAWRLALSGDDGLKENFVVALDANVSQRAVTWVSEVLHIFDALLLAALAPMFGSHRLLFCRPSLLPGAGTGTGWHAGFETPLLEGHPDAMHGVALKAAFAIEDWTRNNADFRAFDTVGREAFFLFIEQHAIAPLRSFLTQGKSTLPVLRAAFGLGVPFAHLGGGVYQLGWGAKARRVSRSSTDHDSATGATLAHRKDLMVGLLRSAGLPAPTHLLVNTVDSAHIAAKRIGWPVVVKPADSERGEGVQVDVQADGLDAAYMQAYQQSTAHLVLIERQVRGICHRIFVAGGQLLYAVRRLPIGVYGDGELTVAQLIEKASESERLLPQSKRSPTRPTDELALKELARQGLQIDSVPKVAQFVALRRIETTAWGGVDEDVTSTIHPENVRAALAASALCGLEVAGIDMISNDITVPWHANGAVINEVNFSPVLGEGIISQRYVKTYVTRLLDSNGRIPVEVYAGNSAAVAAARQAVARLRASGLAVVLTSHDWTEAPDGQAWPMAVDGLHARIRALLLSHQVGAMVIVVQTDELVDRDLPLEGVDAVHLINDGWASLKPHAALQRKRELLRLLQAWQWV